MRTPAQSQERSLIRAESERRSLYRIRALVLFLEEVKLLQLGVLSPIFILLGWCGVWMS